MYGSLLLQLYISEKLRKSSKWITGLSLKAYLFIQSRDFITAPLFPCLSRVHGRRPDIHSPYRRVWYMGSVESTRRYVFDEVMTLGKKQKSTAGFVSIPLERGQNQWTWRTTKKCTQISLNLEGYGMMDAWRQITDQVEQHCVHKGHIKPCHASLLKDGWSSPQ